jgi:hypothetical protein
MHRDVFDFINKANKKNNACIDIINTGIINLNLNYEERIRKVNSLKS